MARRKKVYEGKAKILYEGPEPGTLVQYFKDDATAFNAEKRATIDGKGVLNNRLSEFFMTGLNHDRRADPFHPPHQHARAADPRGRDHPAGSGRAQRRGGLHLQAAGIEEGTPLPRPIVEFYFKNDDWATRWWPRSISSPSAGRRSRTSTTWSALALRVNDFLSGLFLGVGIKLVDFKIEIGRIWDGDYMRLIVADEISPDSCRLWDMETGKKLDKDVFRRDLGDLADAYTEVARRLGVMPHRDQNRLRQGILYLAEARQPVYPEAIHRFGGQFMRRLMLGFVIVAGAVSQAPAQPVEFDPDDFGKIVIQPRQATGGDLTFEQAFGEYQNEPIITYGENSPAVRLGKPIGRLDMMYVNGKTGYCTAFIVDEEHIVTNHHCVPGMDGDPTGKVSNVQAAQFVAGYIKPGRAAGVDRYTVSPQIVETNRELDYTVLKVFGNPSAKYGLMELAAEDPEDGEFLWIIGHPQGQSQHISREGCAAAAPAISDEGKLVHTCDTLGGNSGSPVIRISDKRVIGLHHAGDNRTGFNMAIPMRRILAQSRVLHAAAPPQPVQPPVVVNPPVVKPPVQVSLCDALWNEAKSLGCGGYEAYMEQCSTHTFAIMAKAMIARECTRVQPPIVDVNPPVRPPEVDPSVPTLTVRAAGGGDYRSLVDAVNNAAAGTRIEVYPGTYTGGVDVSKPLSIVGVGRREDIVLRVAEDHVIHWTADSGLVSNLTLRQDGGKYFAFYFDSGTATLEDSDLSSTGLAAIGARLESDPIIRGNLVHDAAQGGIFFYDNATGLIENNTIYANTYAGLEIKTGADPIARNNVMRDGKASGVYIHTQGKGRIENNDIFRNAYAGIEIKDGSDPVILRNQIHDGDASGIYLQEGAKGLIMENEIYANALSGISVVERSDPVVRNNTLRDGIQSGVYVYDGGLGRYEDNVITGHGLAGIAVKEDADPVFVRNEISNGKQSGIFIYDNGRGLFEDNVIFGNAYFGFEIKTNGNPVVRNNRIHDNIWHAFRIYENGTGTYENNDLTGNDAGAFDIDETAGQFTRRGNRE
jgi:phosphoribosylaminoimidazole-succinocarboxamide synthase